MKHRTGFSSRLAIAAAMAACLFTTGASAASGSISFSGAIVPSSYDVVVSAAGSGDGVTARGAELRFVASPSDPKSAEVRVERPDHQPIAVRCGAGMQPASGQGCRLGGQGGSLTMVPPAGQPAVAVVITSYN